MAAQAQAKPADLHFGIGVVQVGEQIMVQLAISDNFGLSTTLTFAVDVARNFSKAIKAAVEQAEVTLVKPPSIIHEA
jgi:hypothetical protein